MEEQNQNKDTVTTNEIMDFLVEHMATKEELKEEIENVRKDMGKLKLDLLDAMDDKLANLKWDLIVLMRGEDQNVVTLVELLQSKKVLTSDEAKGILAMKPFPQLAAQLGAA